MKLDGVIKNIPNEIFDGDYALANSTLFMMCKLEYSFVKYLRRKVLAAEIGSQEDLQNNIKKELSIYDAGTLGGKQYMFGQVNETLAHMLNDFDEKKNNKFNGYKELEQYHTISGIIVQMMPEILMAKIIGGAK